MSNQNLTNLSHIMRNRRELRNRGVSAGALHVLESIARACPKGLTRLSVAAIGRMIGITRSVTLRHVQKLEALGLVVRIGSAIMVNARTVLRMAADAVKNRAAHLKRLFTKRKSKSVAPLTTHRDRNTSPPVEPTGETRQEARRALDALYIPPHLRKNR